MNIHPISADHRHISLIYFAAATTDQVTQPDNHERTECRWMTMKEIETADDLHPAIKHYAKKALEKLTES